MALDREHRLDTELNRLLDDLSRPDSEKAADTPGKRTRVQELAEQLTAQQGADHAALPGRRTLVERLVAMARPLQFDDFRVAALRDTLTVLGGKPELRDATAASADRNVARRAVPGELPRAGASDDGDAMWRASERRAVTMYRHAADTGEATADHPEVEAAIARAGSGAPLDAAVRTSMEAELGVGLDRVRVHTDPVAAKAARALHAEAFTIGEDIFFADGMYAPDSASGRKLLAHELTHVVQSWQGKSDGGGRRVSQPGDPLEREADKVADKVGGGASTPAAEPAGPAALPGTAPRPGGGPVSRSVQRKPAQAPRGPAENPATVRPQVVPRLRSQPSNHPAGTANQAFKSHLDHAGKAMKAAFTPLHAGVADAKNVKIGAKAAAKGKHEKHQVDHHVKDQHAHAAKHKAAAAAHKAATHDEHTEVPPPPKLDAHSPIQFKKVSDWSKYMPPPMQDQDERERKHIQALVRNKVIGEQAAAQKTLGSLHAAQVAGANAVRKMKPGLQAQVAGAQKSALGQVAASESSQAAAVSGAYSAAQGKVNGAASAAKAKVNAAYTAAVAAINASYQTTDQKLTTGKTNATTQVSNMETAQLNSIRAAYQGAHTAVSNAARGEADHARSLGDSVALPYDGDKLDAAKEAAHNVANGWAGDIPGKMEGDAQSQIYGHQSESESGTTTYAGQQKQSAEDLYNGLKPALDTAHQQALDGAGKAKDQALQQIDSIAASTCASLAAQSASQVASVHQQAASARTGITKAGQTAIAGIVSACDKAAKGLDGGAAGLAAGAKQVEAPSPEFTAQKVAEGEKLLHQGTSSISEGLTKNAGEAAKGLTQQAGDTAKSLAAIAASAKQSADQAAQGASQSISSAAQGSVESLHKMQEGFVNQAKSLGEQGDTKFKQIVDDTKTTFSDAATKLNSGLTSAVEGLRSNYRSSIDSGETKQIQDEAKKAADAVKPWWQKALAVVCEILVVIVIMVVVTVLTAGLGTGLVAVGIGILAGAAAGAVSSIASQVVGNLIMGEPAFNIDWKEVGISALAGAITGGLAAGAGEFGGAAVSGAMQGAKGVGNYAIRFGVNAGAGMIGDVGAHIAFDGHYELDMKNLAITLGTAAVMSHSKVIGAQNKLGDGFRAKVGLPPIHAGGVPEGGLGGPKGEGGGGVHAEGPPGGGVKPDVGGGGKPHAPETGGGGKPHAPETGGGGKPHAPETGGGGKPTVDEGGGVKPPKPTTDEAGGVKPPKPTTDEAGGVKPPKPTDEAGGGKAPKPDDHGGAPKPEDHGGAPKPDDHGGAPKPDDHGGAPKPDDHGGAPKPEDHGGAPKPDDGGKPASEDHGGKPGKPDDHGGKPAGHDEGGKPAGHDEHGGKPAGHDEHGGKPASSEENHSPEQQAHDAERDAAMREDGYVEGTRAKAEESAGKIQEGGKPGKDGLRDTEANQHGRDALDKLKDPRITPEQRKAIDDEVANRVRGKEDPTGKLDADVKAATDKVAADEAAKSGKPTSEKPTSDKPTSEKPTSEKPTGDKPTGEKPGSEKPGSEKPGTKPNKPGDKPGAKEPDSGLTPEKADDILNTPKGKRPDPKDYLNPDYVKAQMAKFDEGASRIMVEDNMRKYGPGQRDGTSFVMPKSEVDAMLGSAKGDPRALEKVLGLEEGFFDKGSVVRVDFPEPGKFGLRVPSGNEAGANEFWLPGGKLPTGATEGVVDVPGMKPGTDYVESPIKVNPPKPGSTGKPAPTDPSAPIGKDPMPPTGKDPTPPTGKDPALPGTDPATKVPTGKDPATPGKDPATPGKDPVTPKDPMPTGKDPATPKDPVSDPPTAKDPSTPGKAPPTGKDPATPAKDPNPSKDPAPPKKEGGGNDKDPPSKDPPTAKDPGEAEPPKSFEELQDHLSPKAKEALDQQRQLVSSENLAKMEGIGRNPDGTYNVEKANQTWERKWKSPEEFQKAMDKLTAAETGKAQREIDRVNDTSNEVDGTNRPDATVGDGSSEAALKQEAETGEPVSGNSSEERWHATKVSDAIKGLQDAVTKLQAARPLVKDPKVLNDIDAAIARANDRIAKMQPALDLWNNRANLYPNIWKPDGTLRNPPPPGGSSTP